MLRKIIVLLIAVCAFSSLAGVFMAGLNIYTRSTTPQSETSAPTPTSTASTVKPPSTLKTPTQHDVSAAP